MCKISEFATPEAFEFARVFKLKVYMSARTPRAISMPSKYATAFTLSVENEIFAMPMRLDEMSNSYLRQMLLFVDPPHKFLLQILSSSKDPLPVDREQ